VKKKTVRKEQNHLLLEGEKWGEEKFKADKIKTLGLS
jgi:hypothetical protein